MSLPFHSALIAIEPDWIDYNAHLNMGYYAVIFDRAAEEAFARIGFDAAYRARTGHTTYAAEFHVRYLRELKLGDRVRVSFEVLDHDAKRFHTFQAMYHEAGWLAATGETLSLHVDMSGPRVAPMPEAQMRALACMTRRDKSPPDGAGRSVGMTRGRR